ncbi:MAG: diguanylate cyclase [Succinivibrionaceae bacterium]|nr:diguanylate cyclase [Succinivibrionaceae bacterium]
MIRIKHLLFITLIVFCISICYFCLSYYQEFRKYAEQNVGRELYFEEALINDNIKNLLLQTFNVTRYISGRSAVVNALNGHVDYSLLNGELAVIRNSASIVEDVMVLDESGRVISRITSNSEYLLPTTGAEFRNAFGAMENIGSDYLNMPGRTMFIDTKDGLGADTLSLIYLQPVVDFETESRTYVIDGYIAVNIPMIKLISALSSVLGSQSKSVIRVSNKFLYDMEGYVSRFGTQEVKTLSGEKLCTLKVSVSRPADEIEMNLIGNIISQVKKNVIISFVIAVALIVCFLLILHSFGSLFAFISRLEMNNKIYAQRFVLWEFNKTSRLLHDMKQTILSQLHDIERKNHRLQKANNETAEVNRKLADMNATLEKQVQERTHSLQKALELSTNCNNISNVIINQRSQLKDDMKSEQIFDIFCSSIREFNLKRNFCFEYKVEGENREKTNTITTIIPPIDIIQGDSYRYEKGFYKFPLSMKEGEGYLILEAGESAIEPDILTNISVFCREVSSYLDNRALRNRLSFWARTDGLTKLGNRVAYDQQMAYYETSLDSEIGLFLIDANGLKEINDSKGHTTGDALLKKVAGKLHTVFDNYDADIFRIGGDEFITILHGKDLNKSAEILEKLAAVQDKPVPKAVQTAEIAATFAVGYADSRTTPFQMLYKKADHEMYLQKEAYYEMRHRLFGEIRAPRH